MPAAIVNDVVITGIGLMSPLGIGREAAWAAMAAGESGVRMNEEFGAAGWVTPYGGRVAGFEAKEWIKPRKSLKVMAREIQLGFAAGEQAWADAGLEDATVDPERVGVVTGAGLMYCDLGELEAPYRACVTEEGFAYDRWGGDGLRALFPLWLLKYLPNMTACHIGIRRDARGPSNTIASKDVSSLLAFVESVAVLKRGAADVMLTGGASSRMYMTDDLWRSTAELYREGVEPVDMHRPFDRRRGGCVCGEGAAVIVLETEQHALARKARILARVRGVGASSGPRLRNARDADAPLRSAMESALHSADTDASQLAAVSAHGLSTVEDDRAEAKAIWAALGDTLVTAPKSSLGNLGAAGGAVELAVGVEGLRNNTVGPTRNYAEPDPECPVNVATQATKTAKRELLTLSYNPTGEAAAVVVEAV